MLREKPRKYSRTSCKRPPKISMISGRLREIVTYRRSDSRMSHVQALKYFLQSRLTKCPMPLSLGPTKCMIMSDDFEVSLARE